MSIFGKIRHWQLAWQDRKDRKESEWQAKRKRERDWLLEPVMDRLFIMQSGIIEQQRQLDRFCPEISDTLRFRFSAIDSRTNTLEKILLEQFPHVHEHMKSLQAENQAIKEELNGIRSRYKWIEDRYEDESRGKTPRTFDYDKRQ